MGESSAKRPRNVMQEDVREPFRGSDTFRSTIRDGIRDSIQTKIERNEIERKLNIDYMSERTAPGKSHDSSGPCLTQTHAFVTPMSATTQLISEILLSQPIGETMGLTSAEISGLEMGRDRCRAAKARPIKCITGRSVRAAHLPLLRPPLQPPPRPA